MINLPLADRPMRNKKTFLILATVMLIPINGIGIDLYAPSLPAIAHALHATPALTKLTIALYLLGMAFGQAVFGTLSDSWGRRRPLIFALAAFSVLSLLASRAPSIMFLLVVRTLQGFVSAAPSAISKSILTDTFEGKELIRAFSMLVSAWALGPVLAPAAGGYIQHYLGWQANFYTLAIIGLIGALLAFFMPETHTNPHPLHHAIIRKNYKRVLTTKLFLICVVSMVLMYSIMAVFNVMGPYLIQVVMKHNAITNGRVALLFGLGYFLGGLSNRYLLHYFRAESLEIFGLFGVFGFSILMLVFALFGILNLSVITIPGFLIFFCMGWFYPNVMVKALASFKDIGGTASAIMGTVLMFGVGTSVALASFVHFNNQLPLAIIYVLLSGAVVVVCRWI